MTEEIPKVPDQEELEKELSEYLSKKYGYRIKVISPMMKLNSQEKMVFWRFRWGLPVCEPKPLRWWPVIQ